MTLPEIQKSKRIFISFVLAMLVLVLAGVGAYRQRQRIVATQRWVSHTYEVLGELHATLSLIQDVETATRGYVVTGQESYLEPYNRAAHSPPAKNPEPAPAHCG